MSASLLSSELTNLISESKRKQTELRSAADKSLQELKSLPATSDQSLYADLSQRPVFVEPFVLACSTHNPKLANIGVTCLQRLIVGRGLPRSRLQDALRAFNGCADLGLDVKLKILQALPSLLQNYADELKGDLLSGALEVCAALQSTKVQTVSGVAAATLQQLVTTVFDRVSGEDEQNDASVVRTDVPGHDGPISLAPAAYDAFRVFRDLAMAAEGRQPKFVQLGQLSEDFSLELIFSCIEANLALFASHPELSGIVRSNILPRVTRALSDKLPFATTLRSLRVASLILDTSRALFSEEGEVLLGLAIHTLDQDTAPFWKRSMVMEMIRSFLDDTSHVVDSYSAYDAAESGKPIIQDLVAAFVRLSAEKPQIIGLGQQSTVPTGPVRRSLEADDTTREAAGGVAAVIGTPLGTGESNVIGIGAEWSIPRIRCIDQLDKLEAPTIPETYLYALVLECLGSFTDSLAKVVLPLVAEQERAGSGDGPDLRSAGAIHIQWEKQPKLKTVAALVESCWPAVLACSSTFLNAALDEHYYRGLIKAYQRFVQIAGLLRLSTARDALLTTLGKSAVPPQVLSSAIAESIRSPGSETPRSASGKSGFFNVDSLMSPSTSDRDRRGSTDPTRHVLSIRNLLCLRALLNLAIALGPKLEDSFALVIDTLRHAETVLDAYSPQQMASSLANNQRNGGASQASLQALSNEIKLVNSASMRVIDASTDFSNEAFVGIARMFCDLLTTRDVHRDVTSPAETPTTQPSPSEGYSRSLPSLGAIGTAAATSERDYKFAVPKLGRLLEANTSRFIAYNADDSGWTLLTEKLSAVSAYSLAPKEARRAAGNIACQSAAAIVAAVATEGNKDAASTAQTRAVSALSQIVAGIYSHDGTLSTVDLEITGRVVEAVRGILEKNGDTLVAGWDAIVSIISSVFARTTGEAYPFPSDEFALDWATISDDFIAGRLGRSAFQATQLICSDFLPALPTSSMTDLIELQFRFMSQRDDLNISLTTITMVWNVSDFLLNKLSSEDLEQAVTKDGPESVGLDEDLLRRRRSAASQWLFLLRRLQTIVSTGQLEVRKAALQTLSNIFLTHGTKLTPAVWETCFDGTWLQLAAVEADGYISETKKDHSDESVSSAVITGILDQVTHYMDTFEKITTLSGLWAALLDRMRAFLKLRRHSLIAAVWQALATFATRVTAEQTVWTERLRDTIVLWLESCPAQHLSESQDSNTSPLETYVDAGARLHSLLGQSIGQEDANVLAQNVFACISASNGPSHRADVNISSPLQSKGLALLKAIEAASSATRIKIAVQAIELRRDAPTGPTSVALAAAAIVWLQSLVLAYVDDGELYTGGIFTAALASLRFVMEQKYTFRADPKAEPLWKTATTATLALAKPLLDNFVTKRDQCNPSAFAIHAEFVLVARSIIIANGLHLVEDNVFKVFADEQFDLTAFHAVHGILVERLSVPELPEELRAAYIRALFDGSIIHTFEGEEPLPQPPTIASKQRDTKSSNHTYEPRSIENVAQQLVATIRPGRTDIRTPSLREAMSYACLTELHALVLGPRPMDPLVRTATPLMRIRVALALRTFVSDHPLRGHAPYPPSELQELQWCLRAMLLASDVPTGLELSEAQSMAQEPREPDVSALNALARPLLPLLVRCVGIAADAWCRNDEVLREVQKVLGALAASD